MQEIFDTHKFLFTLNHNKEAKGHIIHYIDKDENKKQVIISKIEIGASPITCKIYDLENKKHLIAFLKITKIFNKKNELVWEVDKNLNKKVKIIKGYK
jgi:hypothetical protein